MSDGMPVNTGHDYHLAETRRVRSGLGHLFEAYCDACGWVGQQRDRLSYAEDDATAHDVASNPASNR